MRNLGPNGGTPSMRTPRPRRPVTKVRGRPVSGGAVGSAQSLDSKRAALHIAREIGRFKWGACSTIKVVVLMLG